MTKQLPSPYCFHELHAAGENVTVCKIRQRLHKFCAQWGTEFHQNVHFMEENGTWRNRACLRPCANETLIALQGVEVDNILPHVRNSRLEM